MGHVVIPSVVSQDRQNARYVMNTLNMALLPPELPDTYDLPKNLKRDSNWIFFGDGWAAILWKIPPTNQFVTFSVGLA